MAARAKPQSAMIVFNDRPDFLLGQRVRGRVVHKVARMQVTKTVVGTDPDVSAPVLNQRARAEVGKTIADLVVLRIRARDAAHSFIGGDPHRAVPALQEGAYEIIGQSRGSGVVDDAAMSKPVDSATVCADPKIARAGATDIADR